MNLAIKASNPADTKMLTITQLFTFYKFLYLITIVETGG